MDYYEAGVHVLMHRHAPALSLLERYLGYAPQMKPDVARDPVFEPLHASARFRALVTRRGEP